MTSSTAIITAAILCGTVLSCSAVPAATDGDGSDVVFEKRVSPTLRFEARTRATPEVPATRPATSPHWATGRLEVEYRLIDEADRNVVMTTTVVHRVDPDHYGFRVLDACVRGDRFFVLEKTNIGNALVGGQFDRETGVGRMRTRQSVLTESEALGPILIGGEIVECSATEVRLSLKVVGGETIERVVKLELER